METGQIPKDMLHGELATGHRPSGRLTLCFKDVCHINSDWEGIKADIGRVRRKRTSNGKRGESAGRGKVCRSWIGLHSRSRHCAAPS